MKTLLSLCLLLMLVNPQWGTNFEQAREDALQHQKLILLNFSGSDWCGPCIKLKQDVLDSPTFLTFATNKLNLVRADFPRKKANQLSAQQTFHNEALAERYNPEGKFPYTVLLNAQGKVLKAWEGYPKSLTVDGFVQQIQDTLPQ
jgi:thioredoxin-related protein